MIYCKDVLIVGCGFAGSIIARGLAERGKRVCMLDRRNHIAGNMYDFYDEHGILLHRYGPHSFHTDDTGVMRHLQQYGGWKEYNLRCMVYMDGQYTPSPFNYKTIDQFFPENAAEIKEALSQEYYGADKAAIVDMLESGNPIVRDYARFLFEKDYAPYTAKQWGISTDEIDLSVLRRVPALFSYKEAYFDDKYQYVPEDGYTKYFERLLTHPNIEIKLNTDALTHIAVNTATGRIFYDGALLEIPLIYTGEIDALFEFKHGRLPYRSLQFEWKTEQVDSYQDAAIVAYPQAAGYTRITEYKKLPEQSVPGVTTIAVEYPLQYEEGVTAEPYYPIPTEHSEKQYALYAADAENTSGLYLCGRLAEYKYYNMDQVVGRALEVLETIEF